MKIPGIAELFQKLWKLLESPSNSWKYRNSWNASAIPRIGEIHRITDKFLEFVLVPPLAKSYSPVENSRSRARNLYDNAARLRMEILGIVEQFLEFVLVPPLPKSYSYSPVGNFHFRNRNSSKNSEGYCMGIPGIAEQFLKL
jgi:hypothetical protein